MATPTNLPATFVAGDVLTAAQQNNLRGAFRTLQVVANAYSTQTGTTSATYVTTGLSAVITPQATTNKVLATVTMPIGTDNSTVAGFRLIITIGGVDTTVGTWAYGWGPSGAGSHYGTWTVSALVAPSTTSATTFTVQFARTSGAGTNYAQTASQTSNIILQEISL